MVGRSFWKVDWPNDYYIWLCDMIDLGAHRNYSKLVSFLFNAEFFWSVPNDSNRAGDGRQLRFDYIYETEALGDYLALEDWVKEPCSVLEMLIALARRVRVDIMPDYDIEVDDWFWMFITNLGLKEYDDAHFYVVDVDNKVDDFLSRNGKNELFLCEKMSKTKRMETEIWYQMQFWLAENYDF